MAAQIVSGIGFLGAAVIIANVVLRPLGHRIGRHPTGGGELTAEQRNDGQLEQAVSRLSLEPAVTWTVHTDADSTTPWGEQSPATPE